MYCPQCGAQNTDDTKYCRACGTNLGVVSLALSNPDQLVAAALENKGKDWLKKRREGISRLIKGSGLIGASGLVGVALGVFSNTNDWIFVWLGLASWMACWGIILWSQGINTLIESRFMRREFEDASHETAVRITRELASGGGKALGSINTDATTTTKLAQASSVTEHTTELLNK
jgi:zinc ribbon protein